jgi:hypothetical protein
MAVYSLPAARVMVVSRSLTDASACNESLRKMATRRDPAWAGRNWISVEAGTPDAVTMLLRNGMRNAELFSTRSTKRKSRPKAPDESGTALMNRIPAVGMSGVAMTSSGLQPVTANAAPRLSTDRR